MGKAFSSVSSASKSTPGGPELLRPAEPPLPDAFPLPEAPATLGEPAMAGEPATPGEPAPPFVEVPAPAVEPTTPPVGPTTPPVPDPDAPGDAVMSGPARVGLIPEGSFFPDGTLDPQASRAVASKLQHWRTVLPSGLPWSLRVSSLNEIN